MTNNTQGTRKRKATRNAQGGGSIRQRKDGTWEGRYTVGKDPGTGKPIRPSVYGATQEEVRKKIGQATNAIDEGTYFEPEKITVGRWLDIWVEEYTIGLKPHTINSYKGIVNHRLKPGLGAIKLAALFTPEIQSFYNRTHKGEKNKKGLSAKSMKNVHGVLHRALEQAVEIKYIRYNPSDACKLPRVVKPKIKPLEEYNTAAFLKAISGHKYERLFSLALFTGARQAELIGLTWDCIDFKNGVIYLYRQLQKVKGEYIFETLKNDKTRTITPASTVMQVLQEQRRVQLELRLKAGPAWDNDGGDIFENGKKVAFENGKGLVFTQELGQHLRHNTVYLHFKKIVADIDLPETRFHDTRHTYAINALQAGDDVKTVQENLGHHTAAFTLDTYGHVTERMKRESAARMEEFIQGLKNL